MRYYIKEFDSGLKALLFITRYEMMDYDVIYSIDANSNLHISVDTFIDKVGKESVNTRHFIEGATIRLPHSFKGCKKYVNQNKDRIEILFVPKEMLL